jgi:hypothetical protein
MKDEDGMMNCRRIKELIPLFIGGDLEADGIQEVSLHVSECETCAALLGAYGESQSWYRSQTQPDFDDAFYMDLQQRVMREIASTQPRPSFFHQLKEGLRLTPRWAMAVVMLILVGALALYIYSSRTNKDSSPNQIVQAPEPKEQPNQQNVNPPQPGDKKPENLKNILVVDNPRRVKRVRNLRLNLSPLKQDPATDTELVAKESFDKELEKNPINTGEPGDGRILEERTRMEFQTADPNIRIIWFAPKLNSSPAIKIDTE